MSYAFPDRNTGRILLSSPFSSQNVMKNFGILVRKADVIKNIQEFQSEEIVKLAKPEDYLSSYEKHRINSRLKVSKSSYITSLNLDECFNSRNTS